MIPVVFAVALLAAEAPPEAQPEAPPEAQSEAQPEAQPEAAPEAQPGVQPDAEPEAQPEAPPDAEPEAQPEAKPEAGPEARPAVQPAAQPAARPAKLALPGLPPEYLSPANPTGAAALGLFVGFGTGLYYAGDADTATLFALADSVLWLGLATTIALFTQEVVQNDVATGTSLKLGDRDFTSDEQLLYRLSWAFGGLAVISRLWQGVASNRAAEEANASRAELRLLYTGEAAAAVINVSY